MTSVLWMFVGIFLLADLLILPPMIARARRLPMDDTERASAPGQFTTLDKGLTHFQWFGPKTGDIIVLVHGLSVPSFVFAPLIPHLTKAGFRVLTYDHYGRGWSDRPRDRQTPQFFSQHLLALLDDQMIQKPVTLLGYSMGGAVVTAFAQDHPNRVSNLILLASAGFFHPRRGMTGFLVRVPIIGDWIMTVFGGARFRKQAAMEITRCQHIPDLPQRMIRETRFRGYTRSILSSLRNILSVPFGPVHEMLHAASIPTLAIWAREDELIPIICSDLLSKANPDVKTVILDDADHSLAYSRPDLVGEHVLTFLSSERA